MNGVAAGKENVGWIQPQEEAPSIVILYHFLPGCRIMPPGFRLSPPLHANHDGECRHVARQLQLDGCLA